MKPKRTRYRGYIITREYSTIAGRWYISIETKRVIIYKEYVDDPAAGVDEAKRYINEREYDLYGR